MSYQRLQLNTATPTAVRHFIERTIEDLYFSDIHAMLRLPLSSQGIVAGQNFAITQILMAVISSVSITLYDSKGASGKLFKSVVEEYFPWDEEPSNNVPSKKEAACTIYDVFRNPLTHAGGLFVESRGNQRDEQRYLKQKSYAVKVERLQTQDKTIGHTEEWIEKLEIVLSRPDIGPTLKVENANKVLLVEGLYWCVRRMIRKLTDDSERMANANKMLSAYT